MNTLRELRRQLKISQIEAASILNISRRTYQKYESLNENNDKINYLVYRLNEEKKITEEKGVLTIDMIKKIVADVFANYEIKSCYLFGSYAKGKETELSDVDLLIDSTITGLDYFGLIEDLREALHKKVDLLTMHSIKDSPQLMLEILKDGIKIYG